MKRSKAHKAWMKQPRDIYDYNVKKKNSVFVVTFTFVGMGSGSDFADQVPGVHRCRRATH